ncbi:MAG: hypothetical protein ACK5LF_27370 [Bacteroides xylanisolvens]
MKRIILSSLLVIFVVGCIGIGSREVADNGYMNSGYTKKELEAKGVNTKHLFVFTEKCATYNGQVFSIGIPIDSLIKIFGPENRILYGKDGNVGYNNYFWDEIGFVALVSPEKEVMQFNLHWDYVPKEKEYDYDDPDPAEVPVNFFKGKILLNGVPLDNTSDYADYCNNKEVQSQLRKLARKEGIRNYTKCFYNYGVNSGCNRYHSSYHKLYCFDYTMFEIDPLVAPCFSYRVKIFTETGQIHEFGMQHDVYTNPDAIDLF